MLNIFGLDYDKFINNKTLVDCLNKIILTEFFANTVHLSPFNIPRFNQTEYLSHISKLMKEAGIEDVEGKEIRNANLAYNTLSRMISHNLYSGQDADGIESYLKIIRGTSAQDIKTWKVSEIREKIKTEVDKNPMLKLIMGNHQVSGNLVDLKSSQNPIIEDRSYYGKQSRDWVEQMSQENIDLFKIQLSSLIK